MTIALWIVQVLLAGAFLMAGQLKAFQYERAKAQLKWPGTLPKNLVAFIGISEILGAVGLVLPALTRTMPILTAWAAMGLATVMVLAAIFHITRREYPNIAFNFLFFALAVFVAYGRFVLAPL